MGLVYLCGMDLETVLLSTQDLSTVEENGMASNIVRES